ncbi:MAG TPA: Txe/YoeB family addiction module toxin [Mesorhizobium sp.]|jgi:toxin YoeB
MSLLWTERGWSDYLFWQVNDPKMLSRINEIITDTRRSPFKGIGSPEPLRQNLKGWWSRRITQEHRLIYRVQGTGDAQVLEISSCRFHYAD